MDNKQLTDLIKRVSTDQKLQLTEDTSLLSEERYPMELSPLFDSLTKPTSLQDAVNLLRWDRTRINGPVDRASHEQAKTQQNNLRKALQLTPDNRQSLGEDTVPRLEGQNHGNCSQCGPEDCHSWCQER